MFTKTTLTALSAVLAFGLVGVGQSATAQTAETVSVTVPYGDLDLSSNAGASEMLLRIKAAARTICGTAPTDPLENMSIYKPCVQSITNRAVGDLNNSAVAELNNREGAPVFASAR